MSILGTSQLPIKTPVALLNPEPVIVTTVPPVTELGLTVETARYVKVPICTVVPPASVTLTATVPADPGGLTTSMIWSFWTVKELALVVPKNTAVAPVNPVLASKTGVPPEGGPELGRTETCPGQMICCETVPVPWSGASGGMVAREGRERGG